MSDKKPTSKKQDTPKAKGKTVQVGPAKEGINAVQHTSQARREEKPADKPQGFGAAYEAGRRASETGAKGVPPAEYNGIEVRAWYEGYKSHANPNAEGQVKGIDKGYRSKY